MGLTIWLIPVSYTLLQVSCVIERTVTVRIHRGHSHVGVLMDVTQILGTV